MEDLPAGGRTRRAFLCGIGAAVTATGVLSGKTAADPGPTERRIVGVEGEAAAAAVRRRVQRVVRELDFGDLGTSLVVEVDPTAVDFEAVTGVRYVEAESAVRVLGRPSEGVTLQGEAVPWGIERIGAADAHEAGYTGAGADVAIIDSGIDSDHPDLVANLGEGYGVVSCDSCHRSWDDDHDHGTHVAGIAAGVDNGRGVVGVSPDATLHAVKAMGADGSGDTSTLAEGLRWAADQGYDVANLSLGSTSASDVLHDAVRYAVDEGMVVVAAAGNEEPDEKTVHYPAAFPEVIAVGATTEDDDLASFSLTGDAVEIAAPGDDVRSTVIDDYAMYSGTSMATPHVTGVAALLSAEGYSATEIRERLVTTAEDLGLDDEEIGHGLLDARAALEGTTNAPDGFAVETYGVTEIEPTEASLDGELVALGDEPYAVVGFDCWEDTADRSTARRVLGGFRAAPGSVDATVSDLSPETAYRVVAVGANGDSRVSGEPVTFTTPPAGGDGGNDDNDDGTLAVTTNDPSEVGTDGFLARGAVTEFGAADEVEPGFEYWVEGRKAETLDDDDTLDLEEPGPYEESISFLEPGTTYVVRAVAHHEDDVARGEQVTVRTSEADSRGR